MIPPQGRKHRWTCPNPPEICHLIDSTFNEFTGLPRQMRIEAVSIYELQNGRNVKGSRI